MDYDIRWVGGLCGCCMSSLSERLIIGALDCCSLLFLLWKHNDERADRVMGFRCDSGLTSPSSSPLEMVLR